MQSAARSMPRDILSSKRTTAEGWLLWLSLVMELLDSETQYNGRRIGKPASYTSVVIRLLFPPFSKYNLPSRVATVWPERTNNE